MTWRRWAFTALSFAAVIGVSVYFILGWWRAGSAIGLPLRAHLLAIAAVLVEILTRSWKITWSAKAAHIELKFFTALRTTLAGDFGASITPARSGAEPARFLVLAEAGVPTASALVVLFAELFLEALSLATVVVVVAIVFRHAGVVLGALVGVVGGYAGFVLGIAAIAMGLARKPARDIPPTWARRIGLGDRRWIVIERWLAQVRTTVDSVRGQGMIFAMLGPGRCDSDPVGMTCSSAAGSCPMPGPQMLGAPCFCPTPWGPVQGIVTR